MNGTTTALASRHRGLGVILGFGFRWDWRDDHVCLYSLQSVVSDSIDR